MKQCLKCGHVRKPDDRGPDYACPKCAAVYAKVEALTEKVAVAKATGNWAGMDPQVVRDQAAKVVLSTTSDVPGHRITDAVGIVSADYAYSFGAIFESVAGLARNIVGSGKSGQTVTFLREGRAEVLNALRFHALDIRADAVVGIKIDYEEFSGANNHGVLMITATGTAVRVTSAP